MALGNMRNHSQKFIPPKLMITSMMDMFTIILIFLLFQFSEKPETINLMNDIELPKSTAKMEHEENIKLVLTRKGLHIGEELIAQVKMGSIIGLDPQNPKASVLYQRLEAQFAKSTMEAGEKQLNNHILLLCDRKHSFKTINSIVKTAALAGYPNFQFGVLKE
ncbi:MAG: biopolymer transporter ExbD [Deltaproteobacteria bacterium]|nr:biopolymer transporter ExbD [Deltaproteobacteria bacterium]